MLDHPLPVRSGTTGTPLIRITDGLRTRRNRSDEGEVRRATWELHLEEGVIRIEADSWRQDGDQFSFYNRLLAGGTEELARYSGLGRGRIRKITG